MTSRQVRQAWKPAGKAWRKVARKNLADPFGLFFPLFWALLASAYAGLRIAWVKGAEIYRRRHP